MTTEKKYGFDHTSFYMIEDFEAVLAVVGLEPAWNQTDRGFEWFAGATGIKVVTGNNPITGEFREAGRRGKELGFASYMSVEGDADKVDAVVAKILEVTGSIKEHSKSGNFI